MNPPLVDNTDRYLSLLSMALRDDLYRREGKGRPAPAAGLGAAIRRIRTAILVRAGRHNKWPARAHTMLPAAKLDTIRACIEACLRDGVPGDLIETGVWRGGATIYMKGVLATHGVADRKVYVADSFAGLPRPDATRYPQDEGDRHHRQHFLKVDRATVEESFRRYGLLDENVVFVEGFFEDSLPKIDFGDLAVLRLDGDMYGSTIQVLDLLYDRVPPGGFVIIDDYKLAPCRAAVHDFRDRRGIADPLLDDATGKYWRKG